MTQTVNENTQIGNSFKEEVKQWYQNLRIKNLKQFKYKELKFPFDTNQLQFLQKMSKKHEAKILCMNTRLLLYVESQLCFQMYFFDSNLKHEKISLQEVIKQDSDKVNIENISLSEEVNKVCLVSVYLSNKMLFLYLIRFTPTGKEVVRIPFKIELKVCGSNFQWRKLNLYFHCMNEVH